MTPVSGAAQWAQVGAAVRERMTALGITEAGLARKTALSAATIRGVLRGAGRRQRWTMQELSRALGWPAGYLTAIAEGGTPQPVPEGIPVRARGASAPMPPAQAAAVAALAGLADLGHGASLQAEANATAARLAREMSEGMTPAQRIAAHQFLTTVAGKVRWPQF